MDSFTLKITACLFMVIDHAAYLFPPRLALYMHWIGRLALPLFMFLCVQAVEHTRSRKRYVLRLYVASVLMAVLALLLDRTGNAFTTLFHIALITSILSLKRPRQRMLGMLAYVAWQAGTTLVFDAVTDVLTAHGGDSTITICTQLLLSPLLGNVVLSDGGLVYILLGVTLWLCRKSRLATAVGFSLCCVAMLLIYNGVFCEYGNSSTLTTMIFGYGAIHLLWMPLTGGYEWMMIGALPFMLAYNGKRGRPVKWFFYWFYPAHITVITLIMHVMGIVGYGGA